MCYTCVNMSCTVLEALGDPNWRPRFPFHHWSVSLVGTILCLWMMFAMDPLMATLAMVFCAIVFGYASFNSAQAKWGDGFQGMKFQVAKNILTKMDLKVHAKNWRPQLLVITKASITGDAQVEEELVQVHDPELLKFVSQLKGGRGFVIVGGVCCSSEFENFTEGAGMFSGVEKFTASDGQVAMQKLLHQYGISGFGKVIYTHDFQEGVMGLVQNAGLGTFQPNCVMASWPREWRSIHKDGELARTHLIRLVQTSIAFSKVVLIPKGHLWPNSLVRLGGYIDIWWIVGSGDILLLLPHLLRKHRVWRECRTRLWVLADKAADDPVKIKQELKHYVTEFRLEIEVHVKVVDPCALDFGEELGVMSSSWERQHSKDTAASEPEHYELKREFSGGSTKSKEELVEGMNRWIASHSAENEAHAATREISRELSYLAEPPGSIGRSGAKARGLDEISFGVEGDGALARGKSGESSPKKLPTREFSNYFEDGVTRRESKATRRQQRFLHSKDQLISTRPMSAEKLLIPRGLNQLIVSESKDAELVVTNLPDMSKTESAFGYFQFVAALTKDMPRVVLVRGTSTEVITAFT
mmetsp:Transcript_29306/g.76791  ORF Transcript_29306/g.76791 Transcript_29306/m.76791 type:complete len:584 (-) Transcript_29306:169-1920(-)